MIDAITGNLWRAAAAGALAIAVALALWIFGMPIIGGGLLAKVDHLAALNASNVESHRQTKANYKTAAAQATAAQIAANHKPARDSAIIARISDATAPAYYDALRRYADGMRAGKAAERPGGGADLPRADSPVESPNDAADPAEWVSVARADWALVTAAAGQGYLCARDGQALIAAGAAVAAPEEHSIN